MKHWHINLILTLAVASALWSSGVVPAIVPQAVPAANKQGNGTKFQIATGSTPTAGNCLTVDASANLIDSGISTCGGAGTQVNSFNTRTGAVVPVSGDYSFSLISGLASFSQVPHIITAVITGGGSVVNTGDAKIYPSANFSCTISKAMISSDQSGSITVDVWKANAAIPTSGNKISASAPVTLSSSQLNQNSSLTGWSTSVVANDVFGFSVATVSTVTSVTIQLWCN